MIWDITEMKLLPFNLERALAGDPVVTRDGREVKQIAYFKDAGTAHKVYALIGCTVEQWNEQGVFSFLKEPTRNDLFMLGKTVRIGDREVLAPLDKCPEPHSEVFLVCLNQKSLLKMSWKTSMHQYLSLENGLVYSGDDEGRAAAEEALEAWVEVLDKARGK